MNIAVFASGSGTNAEGIIQHFKQGKPHRVSLVVCNNPDAYVLKRAENHQVPSWLVTKKEFENKETVLAKLKSYSIDFIVLAGFLWKIPDFLIQHFNNRIINIHPALLPEFGGKGMYGLNVHHAVLSAGKKESGISIHYVNEKYDDGVIILQKKCTVSPEDSPQSLALKVLALEHEFYPETIEKLLNGLERL